jgi:hypothetical protein
VRKLALWIIILIVITIIPVYAEIEPYDVRDTPTEIQYIYKGRAGFFIDETEVIVVRKEIIVELYADCPEFDTCDPGQLLVTVKRVDNHGNTIESSTINYGSPRFRSRKPGRYCLRIGATDCNFKVVVTVTKQ